MLPNCTKLLGKVLLPTIFIFSATIVLRAQVSPNASAANWDTLPFKSYADYKLQPLNKSYITTGILYDRMLPIADIDGHLAGMTMPDTTFPDHFTQAYYEMYNSAYNTTGWETPDQLDSLINSQGNNNHPIGLFYYTFNVLDSNALQDHLVDTTATGQFVDVAGRPRSPYFTYTSFIATPLLAEDQIMESGNHTFYIDQQFFLHNEYLNITQIRIDFGDGQGEWVVNNPFGSSGQSMKPHSIVGSILKNVLHTFVGRIVVVGIDILGRTVQYGSPFKVFVKDTKQYAPLTYCKGLQKWVIDADPAALTQINTQYPNTQLDYKGRKDTAYFYFSSNGSSCNRDVLQKPVVFIDGFDPTNSRGVKQIYEDYINALVDRNNQNVKFGDYMLNQGYDFVILDFKHGNDLIERNAMTLVALLQKLNQIYGSSFQQDITLIGPSMGSLIAQYALAYMEHNNIPHHVKTYISFDGCHQGANVPIGLQDYVEYITKRGVLKKIKLIREGLYNGLAARQMLADHVSANSQFPAPDALRTKFLQTLAAVGEYPNQCRKVAIINGANNGTLNPYQGAGTDLLSISLKRKGWKSIWGLCNDNICKIFNWTCKTAPNNSTIKVAEMWTASPLFNILFWVPLGKINYYGAAAWGNSSLDNAPGGEFGEIFGSAPGDIRESNFTFLLKETLYLITGSKRFSFNQNLNNFTMMPSYSAADLRFTDKNLYMDWSNQYLCGKTPFDYVYAPSTNQQHVYVSQENSVWFENEIKCNGTNLPMFVGPINGSDDLCGSATYSLPVCKPGISVTWFASPSGIVSLAPNGNQVTVTRIMNGNITLSATISNSCTFLQKQKNIKVLGTPSISLINIERDGPSCVGTNYQNIYFGAAYNGEYGCNLSNDEIAEVDWQINSPYPYQLTNNTGTYACPSNLVINPGIALGFAIPNNPFMVTLRARVKNKCGIWSGWSPGYSFQIKSCSPFFFTISPNPASEVINISSKVVNKQYSKIGEAGNNGFIKEVKIYTSSGKIVKQQQFNGNASQVQIDVSSLTPGIYIVNITDGQQTETQKLVIGK